MAGRMAAGTTSPPVESLFLVAGPGNPLILDSMDWASFDWAFHLLVLLSDDALIIHPKDLFMGRAA